MRLIDADALINEVDAWGSNDYDKHDFIEAINNAPTITDRSLEIAQKSVELGRKVGQLEGKLERTEELAKEGWIPIKTRDLTDEEKHELYDAFDINILELTPREAWTYCCKLPEEDQDVLVTTNLWEEVTITTFHADEDGVYFEDYEDRDDLLAWMPLPKPYKTEGGTT